MTNVDCIDLTPIIPTTFGTPNNLSTEVFNQTTNSTSVSSTESDNSDESSSVTIAVSKAAAKAWYGMEWKMIYPYSILVIFFHSISIPY